MLPKCDPNEDFVRVSNGDWSCEFELASCQRDLESIQIVIENKFSLLIRKGIQSELFDFC